MLRILVEAVFDKALDEPNFVDMYADLCVRLNERSTTWSFVKVGRWKMIGGLMEEVDDGGGHVGLIYNVLRKIFQS